MTFEDGQETYRLHDQEALESAAICRRLFGKCDELLSHTKQRRFIPFVYNERGKDLADLLIGMKLKLPWILQYHALQTSVELGEEHRKLVRVAKILPGGDVVMPRIFVDTFDSDGAFLDLDRYNGTMQTKLFVPAESLADGALSPYIVVKRGRPTKGQAEYYDDLIDRLSFQLGSK